MKTVKLTLILAGLSVGNLAMAIPSSMDLTCRQAAEMVNAQGAVVLSPGPGRYERYVRDGSFCAEGLATEAAWIPTKDSAECFVGSTCVSVSPGSGQ